MTVVQERVRPLIGITTGSRANFLAYTAIGYGIWLAGGRPIRVSPKHNLLRTRNLKGLVVSGGADIDPTLYGQNNTHSVGLDPYRDRLEAECVEMAFAAKLPVLGICRGAQMINIVRGGDLHQDVPSVFEGFLPTQSTLGKIFARRKVVIEGRSALRNLLDKPDDIWVNSLHHQAINTLGQDLRAIAHDAEFGMVQAIEGTERDHFVIGVQWHPEFMLYASAQRRIFAALVASSSSGGALAEGGARRYSGSVKGPMLSDWPA
ncbi:gamma-glutamyl-gamma-aminobutyrate hydrolase family protein [Kordiimonas aestuarii]|uniref:gamma-glutamyl-gamma-aminobutyrate hydrolase family protein n=1 Tax=Kordiimonas aestuarii TaxID=1005925 RepID=UPI0021D1B3A9|nr:type 1 glutamine amidotransferase [Kordiimonas aestuarii]